MNSFLKCLKNSLSTNSEYTFCLDPAFPEQGWMQQDALEILIKVSMFCLSGP